MGERRARRGLVAEFESGARAVEAVRRLRARGYRRLDLHLPYEVPGAQEALGLARPRILPRLVLLLGLVGAAAGYLVQWYTSVVAYPLDVGGRPLHSAPAFVPITFEMGILLGAFAAFFGLLGLSRLLRLWQPIFEVPGFERVTTDRYWLVVDAADPRFSEEGTSDHLRELGPLRVEPLEVEG